MLQKYVTHSGNSGLIGLLFLLFVLLAGSGCRVYPYIPEGQRLISGNKVVLEGAIKSKDRTSIQTELSTIIDKQPNTRVFGLFRTYLWIHYRNQRANKDNWYRRFLRDNLAEEPVYADSSDVDANLENMIVALHNKGFFHATGTYTIKPHPKRPLAQVIYQLEPGDIIRIRKAEIRTSDKALIPLLPELNARTTLKPGTILQSEAYSRETGRITQFLRNEGYAFFFPSQITPFQVATKDTASHLVDTYLEILPPGEGKTNEPMRVGNVTVSTRILEGEEAVSDTSFQGFRFLDGEDQPFLKPDVLYRALDIRPDSIYREDDFAKTNKRLSLLGIYRFVDIRTKADTVKDLVHLNVRLTPASRLSRETGFEVNNTTAIGDNSNVLGMAFSGSVSHRNLLRRAIRMEFQLEPSVETNLNPIQANALNINSRLKVQFPFFEDYFRVWERSYLKRWYPWLWDDARSRMSLGFAYNNLLNFWETQFINLNYGFEYNPTPSIRIVMDHFQTDFYKNDLKSGFLDNAPPGSELAFQNQFLTGFLFRSISGNYRSPINRFGETTTLRVSFEQSGTEVLVANSIARLIEPDAPVWKVGNIGFAKYVRGEGQVGYTRIFEQGGVLATRFWGGIVVPFADSRTAPYLKQFAAGGPSSMRGWQNGQLGPGGYRTNQTRPPYFQRGDLRLEANIEWRQKIFWILEGAAFLDAGNVWTLQENPELPGSGLRNMHREWGLAGGLGIRLNFQFFVIVYDVGAKLRYPYAVNGSHWARRPDLNFLNLLINYPF